MKIFNYFENLSQKHAIFIIILIACFHFINTLIVLKTNNFYSAPDESVTCIVDMSHSFCQEYTLISLLQNLQISDFFHSLAIYWKPPLYFLTAIPWLYFINDIPLFISLFNFLVSSITLFSVYGILAKLHSKQAGLTAALTLSLYPLFFSMHRTFFIETLLAAVFALCIYIMILYRNKNIFYSLTAVSAISAGLLTKEQFIIYIPFLLMFSLNKKNINIFNILYIFSLMAVASAAAYLFWYAYLNDNIFVHLINYAKENLNADYFFYFKELYFFGASQPLALLFAAASLYFLLNKKYYIWFLTPLILLAIFSVSGNKVTRHIFPVIIFMPVVITLFLFEIKNAFFRKTCILLLILTMTLQFFLINYSQIQYYRKEKFNIFNHFKGISFAFYYPEDTTYKMQYDMLKNTIPSLSAANTAFIQVFTPLVFNFLIFQKDRNAATFDIYTYNSLESLKNNHSRYKNVIISDRDKITFNEFDIWSKNTQFRKWRILNLYNHDNATIWLYGNKTDNDTKKP